MSNYYPNFTIEIQGCTIPITNITQLQNMGDRLRVHMVSAYGTDSFDFYLSKEEIEEKVREYQQKLVDLEGFRSAHLAYNKA